MQRASPRHSSCKRGHCEHLYLCHCVKFLWILLTKLQQLKKERRHQSIWLNWLNTGYWVCIMSTPGTIRAYYIMLYFTLLQHYLTCIIMACITTKQTNHSGCCLCHFKSSYISREVLFSLWHSACLYHSLRHSKYRFNKEV